MTDDFRFHGAGTAIGNTRGLTLVELMVVLVLSLMLMSGVYAIYQTQHAVGTGQEESIAVQQDLRSIMDIVAWDLRQTGCDPLMSSTAGLYAPQSGPNAIRITMDMDDDGDTSDTNPDEDVTYTLNGTSLLRNGVVLVQNVTTFGISYLDVNDGVITPTGGGGTFLAADQVTLVRSVDVTITIQSSKVDPSTHQNISRSMTKRVRMKNLGL